MLGYQNQAARVGGIIAPFIVMASAGSSGGGSLIPFLTFGTASVLAGLLIFTLPETLGVPLPDTMEVRFCCCCFCCLIVNDWMWPSPRADSSTTLFLELPLTHCRYPCSSQGLCVGISSG